MKRLFVVAVLAGLGSSLAIEHLTGEALETLEGPADIIQAEYCPMWEIWHGDKDQGVPINQRHGWPDQAGRYFQECEEAPKNED